MLKINADELLEVTDDGMFIHAMRNYFATLGDSAHPSHSDPRVRAITNFQELLVVAFREFNVITDDTIFSERRRFRAIIADEIENFSKRAAVRNLKTTGRFSRDQVGMIYDKFFAAVVANPGNMGSSSAGTPTEASPGPPLTPGSAQDSAGKLETRIDLKTFKIFLSEIATWARDETITANAFSQRVTRKVAEHELIERYVDGLPGTGTIRFLTLCIVRIFYWWDTSHQGSLSLQVCLCSPALLTRKYAQYDFNRRTSFWAWTTWSGEV